MSNPQRNPQPALSPKRRRLALLGAAFLLAALIATLGLTHATTTYAAGNAPRVVSQSWSSHDTSAVLRGEVNPEGEATEYRFQYVTQAQWEATGFTGAASVPVPAASLPAGSGPVAVEAVLGGLAPAGAYRFRLLAHNPFGYGVGAAVAFRTLAAEAALGGSCPENEGLRSGPSAHLPDCRAYEQASSVDKNGSNVGASLAVTKASLSGDGITFESVTGVPGGEGSQNFPLYMASREGKEWVTRGLLPPAENEVGAILGWTPDFARVFTDAELEIEGGRALFMRSRRGGPLTELVPYTSPQPFYFLTGFSADQSIVLFNASAVLPVKAGDPAPAPGEPNVYAWDGDSEELSLAGVLPDGSVPAEGTTVIGEDSQNRHAVADDGSVFFYDAETRQLYLRLHPTEPETTAKDGEGDCVPDPLLACTVAVSDTQREPPDPESFEPTFRAAAADGSAAFFTSDAELTDDAHTIPDPAVLGRADISGPEPTDIEGAFAAGPDVAALAAGGSHLYWIDATTGDIARSNLQGEEVEPECIVGLDDPRDLTIGHGADSNHLYWSNYGTNSIGRTDISTTCAAAQSAANMSFIAGANDPLGIDTDGTYLYWADQNGSTNATRAIARATIDGTTDVNLAWFGGTVQSRAIGVAVLPAPANSGHGYLFTARGFGGNIGRTCLDDPYCAGRTGLPNEAKNATKIVTDGVRLYWPYMPLGAGTDNIACSDLNGENVDVDCILAQNPRGIAVGAGADSSHLYWGDHPAGRGTDLYRFEAQSGELADIAVAGKDILGAEVQGLLGASEDGAYAYFVANGPFDGAPPGTCDFNGSTWSGTCSLYLWHEGEPIRFIARLNANPDAGNWATNSDKSARVSADGRTALFSSTRQLTTYDNEGKAEIYRYRVGDPGPTCVSCNPSGAPPSGPATLGSIEPSTTLDLKANVGMSLLSRNLSADGDRVFFESRDPLVADDTNGDEGCPGWGSATQALTIKTCQDVYEWEAKGSGSCTSEAQNGGCLYLLSSGKSEQASFFADADRSGNNAFIFTASSLVGQDEDRLMDVYDVRVGGGLAAQNPAATAPPCDSGDSCKGGASTAPQTAAPLTPAFTGPGNVKTRHAKPKPRRCPKGKVARKVRKAKKGGARTRCVRRHAHRQKRQHRANRRSHR